MWGMTTGSTEQAEAAKRRDEPIDEPKLVRLTVNGDSYERAVRPSRTLLEVLRYDLDLIGTKQGCDKGDCGACTVMVDGHAVLSCLTLGTACDGKAITTVESFAVVPTLDPLLDAFDRLGAGQCGFCTPGMLMSAKALLSKRPHPSRDEIREAISGNLCRCTGYGPIVDAVELAVRIQGGDDPGGYPLPGQEVVGKPLPPNEKAGQ
jgi:2-isopropylmalate synthase